MKKRLILLSCALFFSACSYKSEEQSVINLKSQTLMYAQKVNFVYKDTASAAVISYLNPVLDNKSQKEIFVLSFLPDVGIDEKNISVLIEGRKAQVKLLQKDDELFKYLIKSDYASYYKITLDTTINKTILRLNSCFENQCFDLNFQKISKSVYYRSEDVDTQHN